MLSRMDDTFKGAITVLRDKVKTSSKWTKWLWRFLYFIVGLAATAVISFLLFQKGNKAAKELHKKDVLLEKYEQEKVNVELKKNEEASLVHMAKAGRHLKKADAAEEKIKQLHEETKKHVNTIESITSWDDVDKHIKF